MRTLRAITFGLGLFGAYVSQAASENPAFNYMQELFKTYKTPSAEELKEANNLTFECEDFYSRENGLSSTGSISFRHWEANLYYLNMDHEETYLELTTSGFGGHLKHAPLKSYPIYAAIRFDPKDKTRLIAEISYYQSGDNSSVAKDNYSAGTYRRCQR